MFLGPEKWQKEDIWPLLLLSLTTPKPQLDELHSLADGRTKPSKVQRKATSHLRDVVPAQI